MSSSLAKEAREILDSYREFGRIPNAGGRFSTRLFPDGPEIFDELDAYIETLLNEA